MSAHPESSLQDVINAAVEGAGEGVEATKSMTPYSAKRLFSLQRGLVRRSRRCGGPVYAHRNAKLYLPVACASPFTLNELKKWPLWGFPQRPLFVQRKVLLPR